MDERASLVEETSPLDDRRCRRRVAERQLPMQRHAEGQQSALLPVIEATSTAETAPTDEGASSLHWLRTQRYLAAAASAGTRSTVPAPSEWNQQARQQGQRAIQPWTRRQPEDVRAKLRRAVAQPAPHTGGDPAG